jgi:hypothetical protein
LGAAREALIAPGTWSSWIGPGNSSGGPPPPPASLTTGFQSPPAVASRGDNQVDLQILGGDGKVYRSNYVRGSGFSAWSTIGSATFTHSAQFASTPTVAAYSDRVLTGILASKGGDIYTNMWISGQGDMGWSLVSGSVACDGNITIAKTTLVSFPLQMFCTKNQTLFRRTYSGSINSYNVANWGSWEPISYPVMARSGSSVAANQAEGIRITFQGDDKSFYTRLGYTGDPDRITSDGATRLFHTTPPSFGPAASVYCTDLVTDPACTNKARHDVLGVANNLIYWGHSDFPDAPFSTFTSLGMPSGCGTSPWAVPGVVTYKENGVVYLDMYYNCGDGKLRERVYRY